VSILASMSPTPDSLPSVDQRRNGDSSPPLAALTRIGTIVCVTERPAYIAFEGAEGCGKSTQAAKLAESIGAVLTRETGGTTVGARLRELLHDNSVHDLHPRAEALITAADRAQHLAEVVVPALDAGRVVVSDRSVYSSLAYQGYGRQLDIDEIRHLNEWGTGGVWPTTVVFLDTPDDVISERMSRRDLDRFEAAGHEFHARVLAGFRTMALGDPQRWITVEALGSVDRVADEIRRSLRERGVL
jgi:dTMP kinase